MKSFLFEVSQVTLVYTAGYTAGLNSLEVGVSSAILAFVPIATLIARKVA